MSVRTSIVTAISAGAFVCAAALPAHADIEVIDRGGFRLNVSLQAMIGGFSVSRTDFGVGNLDTNGVRRRNNRNWGEAFVKPGINGEYQIPGDYGSFYFGVSVISSTSFGTGDAISSLAPQALRSTTTNEPSWTAIEDGFGGWRSGNLFSSLGSNAIDVSGGYQSFTVGDGLVIGDGTADGWGRAAYYLAPRTAFHDTAILRVDPSALAPVRATVFHLATNTNQARMVNNDQAQARLVGGTLEWYLAAPQVAGQPPVPDVWRVTGMYFNIYDADSNPALCFSNAAGCTAPALTANRDGLNVASLRAGGSFFPQNRDILTFGEFVYQWNSDTGRRVRAYAWYLEGGYRFSTVMWSPTLTYRYAQFSGDSTPGDGTDRSYDPLFFGSGLRAAGPGTWYLGEIYGQYLGPPSNLNVHQVHLRASPTDTLNVGLIYYLADFNKPGQYGVSRSGAFHEIDVYAEWAPRPWLSVTPTFGAAIPRGGYRDIAQASVTANALPASTRTDRTIYLVQAVIGVKF
ncbi:MAG: alginate export family protein [Alphaproteobacteria bacterium]|nr:alginate export family protein [Alphaproteobacteria bacterium]